MASLSEKLRRERELRGISLKQISEETKIGVRFLEALEQNRLELIPGEFYRRSYLRAYARYLGLDEDRAVNAYLYSQSEGNTEAETEQREAGADAHPWPMWAAGIVLLLGAGFLLLRSGDAGTADESPASASVPASSVEAVEAPTAVDPADARVPADELVPTAALGRGLAPGEIPVAEPSAPLRLVLTVKEPCWLEIEADGVVVVSGLKEVGYQQALSARNEVRLWLGNAGGVSLWVNERPAKPLGRDGQVRKDLTITPTNLAEFVNDAEDFS